MIKFSSLRYEEFKEIVDVLKFTDEENEAYAITKRLHRFIEDLTASEEIFLFNIIKYILNNDDISGKNFFDVFNQTFPDKNFDPEGKLELKKTDYFELELQTINMVYDTCLKRLGEHPDQNEKSVENQVKNAKELTPLINMTENYEYPVRRTLYLKKEKKKPLTLDDFKAAEKYLNIIFKGEKNNVLGKFLHYIENKKYSDCDFFVRHFLTRIAVLSKDVNLENKSNKEFYDNLMKIR